LRFAIMTIRLGLAWMHLAAIARSGNVKRLSKGADRPADGVRAV